MTSRHVPHRLMRSAACWSSNAAQLTATLLAARPSGRKFHIGCDFNRTNCQRSHSSSCTVVGQGAAVTECTAVGQALRWHRGCDSAEALTGARAVLLLVELVLLQGVVASCLCSSFIHGSNGCVQQCMWSLLLGAREWRVPYSEQAALPVWLSIWMRAKAGVLLIEARAPTSFSAQRYAKHRCSWCGDTKKVEEGSSLPFALPIAPAALLCRICCAAPPKLSSLAPPTALSATWRAAQAM